MYWFDRVKGLFDVRRATPPNEAACACEPDAENVTCIHDASGLRGQRRRNEPRQTDLRFLIEQALEGQVQFPGIEVVGERTILASYRTLAHHLKCSIST